MGTLLLTCPHCGGQKMAFRILYNWKSPRHELERWSAGICAGCHGGVLLLMYLVRNFDPTNYEGDLSQHAVIRKSWPDAPKTEAPAYTPDLVADVFVQARKALAIDAPDAAGAMARKTLERATHVLDSSFGPGDRLHTRLDKLAAAQKIT